MLKSIIFSAALPGHAARERRRMTGRYRVACAVVTAAALTAGAGAAAADGSASSPDPVASSGCDVPAAAPGRSTPRFVAGDKAGTYIQDVPRTEQGRPAPVVFDLHGYLEPAELEHVGSGISALGAAEGFVTITPQLEQPGLPRWDFGEGSGDIAYLSDLMSHIESSLCVDRRRIYVTGLSMGAFTTSSLACQLSDRIAAIAPVAGLQDFAWCRTERPVPVVAFHGTADPIVAYTGGTGPNARFLPAPDGSGSVVRPDGTGRPGITGPSSASIPAQAAAWARRNGCGPDPIGRQIASDVTLSSYPCPAGTAVEFYSIIEGGHTWPGNPSVVSPVPLVGATTASISADEIMWDFFVAHPLEGPVHR
ncbi:PHB depolymerase family esterase [Nocardia gamkensis]|uniref:alpha/beta hydrolase family esterase n=1 Tax=Nocardia gamkensis TaxID=352869 RepID=UPI0033FE12FB